MLASTKLKIIIAIAAAIAIMGSLGWLDPARNFFVWLTRPVWITARSGVLTADSFVRNVFNIKDLYSENIVLKERLSVLETENAMLFASLAEYEQLRQALNLREQTGLELTGARVVSTDPNSLNQSLLIDRGSLSGVVEGQAVVDEFGAYVGRVARVFRNTSEITLISDAQSRLPSKVLGSDAHGIVQGQHGLSVALIEVPQGQDLPIGGRVVTGGFTPGVPAGILIGYIEAIRTGGNEVFQEAALKTSADLKKLNIVFVVTGVK